MNCKEINGITLVDLDYCTIEVDMISNKANLVTNHYKTHLKPSGGSEMVYVNEPNLYRVMLYNGSELKEPNFLRKSVKGTNCALLVLPLVSVFLTYDRNLNLTGFHFSLK